MIPGDVLHRGFDAAEVWRVIESERCTVVLGVPAIYKMLMEDPGFETADLSHLRWSISGGARLPPALRSPPVSPPERGSSRRTRP